MTLYTIHMELAREPAHPQGSKDHGYDFVAPLTADGALDLEVWRSQREVCTVRRFWAGEPDRLGHLSHIGSHWRFHYPGEAADEDDPIFRLGAHKIEPGEYISIDEDDGEQHTFHILSVEPR